MMANRGVGSVSTVKKTAYCFPKKRAGLRRFLLFFLVFSFLCSPGCQVSEETLEDRSQLSLPLEGNLSPEGMSGVLPENLPAYDVTYPAIKQLEDYVEIYPLELAASEEWMVVLTLAMKKAVDPKTGNQINTNVGYTALSENSRQPVIFIFDREGNYCQKIDVFEDLKEVQEGSVFSLSISDTGIIDCAYAYKETDYHWQVDMFSWRIRDKSSVMGYSTDGRSLYSHASEAFQLYTVKESIVSTLLFTRFDDTGEIVCSLDSMDGHVEVTPDHFFIEGERYQFDGSFFIKNQWAYLGMMEKESGERMLLELTMDWEFSRILPFLGSAVRNVRDVVATGDLVSCATDLGLFLLQTDPERTDEVVRWQDWPVVFDLATSGLFTDILSEHPLRVLEFDQRLRMEREQWERSRIPLGLVRRDGSIFVFANMMDIKSGAVKFSVMRVQRRENNPDAGKKILRIEGGDISADPALRAAVLDFNRYSTEYFALVTDRDPYLDEAAIEEGLRVDPPDVLYERGWGISEFASWAEKGLLLDIRAFSESEDFVEETLYENILLLSKDEEDWFTVYPAFSMSGIVGAKNETGPTVSWPWKKWRTELESLAERYSGYVYQEPTLWYERLRRFSQDGEIFADASQPLFGESNPDSGGVIPRTLSQSMESLDWPWSDQSIPLVTADLITIKDYLRYFSYTGKSVNIMGYPADEVTGATMVPSAAAGVPAMSEHQEAALCFLRFLFEEECQRMYLSSAIPVHRAVVDEELERYGSRSMQTHLQEANFTEPLIAMPVSAMNDFRRALSKISTFKLTTMPAPQVGHKY